MPLYGYPIGNSVESFKAIAGRPKVVNLTTIAGGDAQNATGCIMETDYYLINVADGTNLSVTLPDPAKYNSHAGDLFTVVNGGSGQTVKVYPPVGGNISAAGANSAASISTSKTSQFRLVSWTASTSVWTSMVGA